MSRPPIEPGRVVLSTAGRDAGRRFVVIACEGDYAFIADGALRQLSKPKRKKLRHLKPTALRCEAFVQTLETGAQAQDAMLRRYLKDN